MSWLLISRVEIGYTKALRAETSLLSISSLCPSGSVVFAPGADHTSVATMIAEVTNSTASVSMSLRGNSGAFSRSTSLMDRGLAVTTGWAAPEVYRRHGLRLLETKLTVEQADGMVECCYNPRSAFAGHTSGSAWSEFNVAYFSSYALWTYMTSPFLFTYPGFVTEEMDPWHEDVEEWRRLKVFYPDYIDSHSREQIWYFGQDGLIRRHDYLIDLMNGARSADYPSAYKEFQGIKMPTSRQVYSFDRDGRKIADKVLVEIDIDTLAFS